MRDAKYPLLSSVWHIFRLSSCTPFSPCKVLHETMQHGFQCSAKRTWSFRCSSTQCSVVGCQVWNSDLFPERIRTDHWHTFPHWVEVILFLYLYNSKRKKMKKKRKPCSRTVRFCTGLYCQVPDRAQWGVFGILPTWSVHRHVQCECRCGYLVQKLHQYTLHLPISPSLSIESSCCNGINLINENDGWSILICKSKYILHHSWSLHMSPKVSSPCLNQPVLRTLVAAKNLAYRLQRYMLTDEDSISKHGNVRNGRNMRKHTQLSQGFDLSKILLHKHWPNYTNESSSCMMSNSLGRHGFASSWRSIQQNSSGEVNTNLLVELMVCERQLHCFRNLLLVNVIASNILFPSHIQQFKNYGWYYNDRPRCWMKASIYQKYPKQTILLTLASHADLALSHPLQLLWG